jgi:membrane protein YdbS with pleckstrin-like domain
MTGSVAVPTERLESRVVAYWLLADGASALFVAALAWLVGRPLLAEHWRHWSPTLDNVLFGACAGLLLLAVIAAPLAFRRWRFGFCDSLLLMRYGILFVEERAVPVRRMQHVDLTRGPIERLFGLATLVVYTAGNEGSAFRVPGLGRRRAEELRDDIVEARGDGRL